MHGYRGALAFEEELAGALRLRGVQEVEGEGGIRDDAVRGGNWRRGSHSRAAESGRGQRVASKSHP